MLRRKIAEKIVHHDLCKHSWINEIHFEGCAFGGVLRYILDPCGWSSVINDERWY